MVFLSHRPRAPLSAYVEHIWLVCGGAVPRRERILPSGTVELVINLREYQLRIDGTVRDATSRKFSGTTVSGAYSGALIIDAMQHAAMMGVHFRPAGASVILGVPCSELTDRHADLAALWDDGSAAELRDRLCEASSHRARLEYLETVLTARLHRARTLLHPAVAFAVNRLEQARNSPRIQDVARECGLSHRRLVTLFTTQVGLTPKLFSRIRRFQLVHSMAQRVLEIDWSRVALECGFYDQSHLANEFRYLSGVSPTAYERALCDRRQLLKGHVAIA